MTAPGRIDVDLGHIRLHALTWGEEPAPLALCLHGFPDSAWTWRHLGPVLAEAGYRVVAPFTRGYAPSAIPADGDYHVAALVDDALAVHRALGGGDDAVLIGHDWGALTVHGIASRADNPFRRVVAMAVPPIAAMRQAGTSVRTQLRLLLRQMVMSWYMAFNQVPVHPGTHRCGHGRTIGSMPTSTTPPDEIDFTGVGGITVRADEWRPPSDDTGSAGYSATDSDRPTGPTILLLYGGGQTRHSWKKTGHLLADAGARVFSLDTRGSTHGDRAAAPGRPTVTTASTCSPVMSSRSSGRSAGRSRSSEPAWVGSAAVEALVLVDVVPRFDQQGSARIRDFMTGNVDGFDTLHDDADAISAYLPHRDKVFDSEGLKRNLRQGDDGRWYWRRDPAFVRSRPGDDRFVRAEHLEEQLASLSVPILLIHGKLFDVVPADAVEGFRAVVPKAEVVELSDAAHTAAADDNDAFTGVVLDFIRARR